MTDLTTAYLGLELRNPLVASAGPLTSTADGIAALAEAGVGAVVLPSVFSEHLRYQAGGRPARTLPPPRESFEAWPGEHLRLLGDAARTAGIPVIGSLNGVRAGGWSDHAAAMEVAGAAAISAGPGLSSPAEAALPRAWISMLRGRLRCSLAASTGVETAADIAAYLLAGADAVMTTSALLRHGPGYAAELLDGLRAWLDRKGFASAAAARGLLSAETGRAIPARPGYLTALGQATGTFGP